MRPFVLELPRRDRGWHYVPVAEWLGTRLQPVVCRFDSCQGLAGSGVCLRWLNAALWKVTGMDEDTALKAAGD